MGRTNNPYPKIIRDEESEIDEPNQRYDDWESGYKSGVADTVCSTLYELTNSIMHKDSKSDETKDKSIEQLPMNGIYNYEYIPVKNNDCEQLPMNGINDYKYTPITK